MGYLHANKPFKNYTILGSSDQKPNWGILMSNIDQGTIIYGMRSDKYSDTCCFGVMISASCDIANRKLQKYYLLTGIEVLEWISSNEGFCEVFKSELATRSKKLYDVAEKSSLNADVLLKRTRDEVSTILADNNISLKTQSEILQRYDEYIKIIKMNKKGERKRYCLQEGSNNVSAFLDQVNQRKYIHYYFLPEVAYKNSKDAVCGNGIMVDFQDIIRGC